MVDGRCRRRWRWAGGAREQSARCPNGGWKDKEIKGIRERDERIWRRGGDQEHLRKDGRCDYMCGRRNHTLGLTQRRRARRTHHGGETKGVRQREEGARQEEDYTTQLRSQKQAISRWYGELGRRGGRDEGWADGGRMKGRQEERADRRRERDGEGDGRGGLQHQKKRVVAAV